MSVTKIFLVAMALLLAALGWRYRDADWAQGWGGQQAKMPNIVFDNGSVRDAARAVAPTASIAQMPRPPAGLRKCVSRDGGVVYTDGACAAGSREEAVKNQVTVLSAPPVPKAPPAPAEPLGPTLREKHMERVINSQ